MLCPVMSCYVILFPVLWIPFKWIASNILSCLQHFVKNRQPPNLGVKYSAEICRDFCAVALWGSQDCAPGHVFVPQGMPSMQWFSWCSFQRNCSFEMKLSSSDGPTMTAASNLFQCAWGILWDLPWSDLILSQLASLVIIILPILHWKAPGGSNGTELLKLLKTASGRGLVIIALCNWRELRWIKHCAWPGWLLSCASLWTWPTDCFGWLAFQAFRQQVSCAALGKPMICHGYGLKLLKMSQNVSKQKQRIKKGASRAGSTNKPFETASQNKSWNLRGPASNHEESHEVSIKIS